MKGYKAFNKDLMCRDMQYEIGKEYEFDGNPIPCYQGFHFCKSLNECYQFYPMKSETRICEIVATGDVKTDDGIKYCTNKIKVVREIKNPREKSNVAKSSAGFCNTGEYNVGNCNSGVRNVGSFNSGNGNCGNRNSGDWNSGVMNSGDNNSGRKNSGNYNFGCANSGSHNYGNKNTGWYNTGNSNTGYWNLGNWNSGLFNTDENPKIKIFDKESDWTMNDWLVSEANRIMDHCPFSFLYFVSYLDMTKEEKRKHPEYKKTRGYLKTFIYTDEDRQKWWDKLSEEDKQVIYKIPNFDANKFEQCTGIKI